MNATRAGRSLGLEKLAVITAGVPGAVFPPVKMLVSTSFAQPTWKGSEPRANEPRWSRHCAYCPVTYRESQPPSDCHADDAIAKHLQDACTGSLPPGAAIWSIWGCRYSRRTAIPGLSTSVLNRTSRP